MTKKNMKKIVFGVFLISFGLFMFVISSYFLEVRHGLLHKIKAKLSSLTVFSQNPLKKESPSSTKQTKSLNLYTQGSALGEKSEPNSSSQVKPNTEGLLWIDRKTGRYVVTLGKKSGLVPGNHLDVYREETLLGQVIVDSVSQYVSVVHLTSGLLSLLTQDYYKVLTK